MKRRVKWRRGDKSKPSNKPIIVIRIQGFVSLLDCFDFFVSVNNHNIFLLLYLFLGNKTCMLQPESTYSVWDWEEYSVLSLWSQLMEWWPSWRELNHMSPMGKRCIDFHDFIAVGFLRMRWLWVYVMMCNLKGRFVELSYSFR